VREPDLNGARYVSFYNLTRQSSVATWAKVADGYFSRLVGLLGTTKAWSRPGRGLWIVPSRGVHTLGMLYSLDLVFLDRNRMVVEVQENISPFRISKVTLRAHSVLELPTGTLTRTHTQVGDQLDVTPAA
jgi:uncharacterized protein